jgi:hypothetical protein
LGASPVALNELYNHIPIKGRANLSLTAPSKHVGSECIATVTPGEGGNENTGNVWNINLEDSVSGITLFTQPIMGCSSYLPPTSGWWPTTELELR